MTHLMTHHPSPYFRVLDQQRSLAGGLPYFLLPTDQRLVTRLWCINHT